MNLGFSEMLFIFVLALLIFGPKKLPEIGRQIGKGLAEFKRASNEFRAQIEEEVRNMEIEQEFKSVTAPFGTFATLEGERTIEPAALQAEPTPAVFRDSSFDSVELTADPSASSDHSASNGHNA